MSSRSVVGNGLMATAAVGACAVAYAAGYEVRAFRLRFVDVPVLPAGSASLRILHLSDLHIVPGQRRKVEWVRRLVDLDFDIVVNTGDNMSHTNAVPWAIEALEPLLSRPGVFVFGSNDYYAPRLANPARYLWTHRPLNRRREDLPWQDLRETFVKSGWLNLTNARGELSLAGHTVQFAGVDDPHVKRDRYAEVAGPPSPDADLTIGVMHAPYRRILDALTADGYSLILAGHTHGGQLRVPGYGALVTNCDLDTGRARGLSQHRAPGVEQPAWLHVSAGLGTSRYAPARFACPPEATVLTLVARPNPPFIG